MRPLLALALVGAAAFGGAAHAEPDCTYAGHNGTRAGLCTEYVCVDICAPEVHVDPQCSEDLNPPSALVRAACAAVDAMYIVI